MIAEKPSEIGPVFSARTWRNAMNASASFCAMNGSVDIRDRTADVNT